MFLSHIYYHDVDNSNIGYQTQEFKYTGKNFINSTRKNSYKPIRIYK